MMQIFDLPRELIECILGFLVGEVGPLFASHYRLVCKLFAYEIQEEILRRQPLIAYSEDERNLSGSTVRYIAIAIDDARFEKLFEQHGGLIIAHEVLRKPYNTQLLTIAYLRNLVEAVLKSDEQPVTDDVRKRYTIEICTALSSVHFKQLRHLLFIRSYTENQAPSLIDDIPSALAATSQIPRFLKWFQDNPRILSRRSILSTPLISACACGHVEMLQKILQLEDNRSNKTADQNCSQGNERHPSEAPSYWEALVAAMKKGQKETGKIVMDRFLSRRGARDSRSPWDRILLMGAVKHVDSGIIGEICHKRTGQGDILMPKEIRHVLLKGTCSALRFLLENQYVDPNTLEDTTPLTLAVHNRRYDLARVLLQHGADINGVPQKGPPITALGYVATTEHEASNDEVLPRVRFLLENGADPVVRHWKIPRQTLLPDVEFLLQQAVEHGNEVALRHETWAKYRDAKSNQAEIVQIE